MDIVLDSNIYRSDLKLRSSDFDVLLDYLRRTDSQIYMPQIVLDEVRELHKRALKERIQNIQKSSSNLNLILTDETKQVTVPAIDEEVESSLYVDFIKNRLKINDEQILPAKDTYLSEVTRRATKREKPCGEDGQGFRDTIIWLTIKEYCAEAQGGQITFISNNDKDFANADKTDLHESLVEECKALNIKIHYFKTIKDFIEKHSVKSDFVTEDWILNNSTAVALDETIINYLNARKTERLKDQVEKQTGNNCSGYCKATNVNAYQVYAFSVYEMLNSSFIVNTVLSCEVEIEYEYYTRELDYRDIDSGLSVAGRIAYNHTYIYMEVYASLTVVDKRITDTEIDGAY